MNTGNNVSHFNVFTVEEFDAPTPQVPIPPKVDSNSG